MCEDLDGVMCGEDAPGEAEGTPCLQGRQEQQQADCPHRARVCLCLRELSSCPTFTFSDFSRIKGPQGLSVTPLPEKKKQCGQKSYVFYWCWKILDYFQHTVVKIENIFANFEINK